MRTALSLLFLTSAAVNAGGPVLFDRQLAIELAQAHLQAYFRAQPDRAPGLINWANPIVSFARDGSNRSFVFVGFSSKADSGGATAVLEICGSPLDLVPSTYGGTPNFAQDQLWFAAIAGNPTADYPNACPDVD